MNVDQSSLAAWHHPRAAELPDFSLFEDSRVPDSENSWILEKSQKYWNWSVKTFLRKVECSKRSRKKTRGVLLGSVFCETRCGFWVPQMSRRVVFCSESAPTNGEVKKHAAVPRESYTNFSNIKRNSYLRQSTKISQRFFDWPLGLDNFIFLRAFFTKTEPISHHRLNYESRSESVNLKILLQI